MDQKTGCILAGKNPNKYQQVRYLGRRVKAHRAMFAAAFGSVPDGLHVCHTCDTPACIAPWHLFAGTNAQNMEDMWKKERRPRILVANQGESNGFAKLTEDLVREIRVRAAGGELHTDLGELYGVSRRQIWMVATRRAWRHVK